MTSSLVGSEMCIRDRYHTEMQIILAPTGPSQWDMSEVVCYGWSPRTVSYTHLTLPTICSV
eukprot:5624531-Prorocentrum_lima.AAC.1